MKRYKHAFEIISALGVFGWGLWLLNPFVDTFAVNRNYAEMARHATENEWGIWAVVIGIVAFVGLRWKKKLLRQGAMLGALTFRTFNFLFIGLQTHFTVNGVPDFFLWMAIALLAYCEIDNDA
jgi:uncharacterized membrane protein YkgB